MKYIITALSALAFLGAATAASAGPAHDKSELSIWEQQARYGN